MSYAWCPLCEHVVCHGSHPLEAWLQLSNTEQAKGDQPEAQRKSVFVFCIAWNEHGHPMYHETKNTSVDSHQLLCCLRPLSDHECVMLEHH